MGYSIALVIKGAFDEPFTAHYSSGVSEFTDDDRLLADELVRRSHRVSGIPWDRPGVDWKSYDLVLIRSTWDFLFRKDEFRNWLDRLESASVRLFNPPAVIRGNISKRYLFRLRDAGVNIIPTEIVSKGETPSIAEISGRNGWSEVVIKPASFGGAYQASRGTAESFSALDRDAAKILAEDDLVVQKFFPEIMSAGEWSFVFFDGSYSHAVRKVPQTGEWREQAQYGGAAVADRPSGELIEQARQAQIVLGSATLFCRVDGIQSEDRLFINEVEMIDARLFFGTDADAAGRCADVIEKRAAQSRVK